MIPHLDALLIALSILAAAAWLGRALRPVAANVTLPEITVQPSATHVHLLPAEARGEGGRSLVDLSAAVPAALGDARHDCGHTHPTRVEHPATGVTKCLDCFTKAASA